MTHEIPVDALTQEERELLSRGEIDPVDVAAVLVWLSGEGPDPWRREDKSR